MTTASARPPYIRCLVVVLLLCGCASPTPVAGKALGVRLETGRVIGGSAVELLDFGNPWIMDGVALVYLAAVIALALVT